MAPKFKGDSDDWLDNEQLGGKGRKRPKKVVQARGLDLPWSQANATVEEVFPNQCRVRWDEDHASLLCSYRWAEVINKSKTQVRERTPVCVGDRVLVERSDDQFGVLTGICSRKNSLVRPAPGRDGQKHYHALAANLDLLVIVASVQEPEFSPGLVDRFLIAAELQQIPILICTSKTDLWKDETKERVWEQYSQFGYEVVGASSKAKSGVDELLRKVEGKTVAFCGHSGVGKTSLLRVLLNQEVGRVAQVNSLTGKGRHTTTGAVLLDGPQDSRWIDTPGVREFGLLQLQPEDLADHFPEFRDLHCRLTGCMHASELQCNATGLFRYSSYLRIFNSLKAGEF